MLYFFDVTKQNISFHINAIFDEKELEKESVVKKYLTTALDDKEHNVERFNTKDISNII